MKNKDGLIEYIGISKTLSSPLAFKKEVTINFSLSKNMEEVIKIQSGIEILDFKKITNTKGYLTLKILNLYEYIENKEEQALCGLEHTTRISMVIEYKNGVSIDKLKGHILNIKGKLLNNRELLIYYKIGIVFE